MLALLAFFACSSNSYDAVADTPQFWHVTLTASMGDADTRALSEGENNVITASFTAGDVVKVLKSDGTEVCELTAKTAGASTTLEGTVSGTFNINEVLTFRYRSTTANYDSQVGTLEGIADNQDYAEGTLTVSATNPLTFTSTKVSLAAKQSITKFTFKCGSNNVSVKTFGIAATGLVQSIAAAGTETIGPVTGTLSTTSSDVYVALRNNTSGSQTYSFMIKDGSGNWYTGKKSAPLINGKNYTADVNLTQLPALSSSSDVGTIGVVGGLPAIVISGNKAVALMNVGALCPEAYGEYYTFANRASGLAGTSWYVPTKDELDALAGITNKTWTTQNGVNGCLFTIGGNTLFLPAAGLDDGDNIPQDFSFVSTEGYYWSSIEVDGSLAYALHLDNDPNFTVKTLSWYRIDALTVRPFHALNNN